MKKNVHLQKASTMQIKLMFLVALFVCFFNSTNTKAQINSAHTSETETSKNIITPPYLKGGDTVAIVAPSGILKNRNKEVNQAIALLKSWNLNVVVGEHVIFQSIKEIRQVFGQHAVIKTQPRQGYSWIAPVTQLESQSKSQATRLLTPAFAALILTCVLLVFVLVELTSSEKQQLQGSILILPVKVAVDESVG